MYQLYQLNDAVKLLDNCGLKQEADKYDKLLEQYSNAVQSRIAY